MTAKLVWITPGADALVSYMARVSNPAGQEQNKEPVKLISYLLEQDPPHWSPFDMVSACMEVTTTRDIAHQAIRHWSFRFQEFSQRYANVDTLPRVVPREARLQDKTNRQHSIDLPPSMIHLQHEWEERQQSTVEKAISNYQWALDHGIAKECARVVLPEGLTATRYYMQGSMRSWIIYCATRMPKGAQKEHRHIAEECSVILSREVPIIWQAAMDAGWRI